MVVETRDRYFGGSLELVSLDGWGRCSWFRIPWSCLLSFAWQIPAGTDVYVRLPKLVCFFPSKGGSASFKAEIDYVTSGHKFGGHRGVEFVIYEMWSYDHFEHTMYTYIQYARTQEEIATNSPLSVPLLSSPTSERPSAFLTF